MRTTVYLLERADQPLADTAAWFGEDVEAVTLGNIIIAKVPETMLANQQKMQIIAEVLDVIGHEADCKTLIVPDVVQFAVAVTEVTENEDDTLAVCLNALHRLANEGSAYAASVAAQVEEQINVPA